MCVRGGGVGAGGRTLGNSCLIADINFQKNGAFSSVLLASIFGRRNNAVLEAAFKRFLNGGVSATLKRVGFKVGS